VAPQVTMGDDVRLTSRGRVDVGTTAFVASGTQSNGWGAGIVGGIGTYATSNVMVDQAVRIGDRARFTADGSLSITPGDDPTGASSTQLGLDATARAHAIGVVAIPTGQARSTLSHASELVFKAGADVTSGGNMFLSARAVPPSVTATGEGEITFGGITRNDIDEQATPQTSSKVTLAGSFLAGRESRIDITIPNDKAGGFTSTVQASPATVFGVAVASAWQYIPDFNPQTYIDQAGCCHYAEIGRGSRPSRSDHVRPPRRLPPRAARGQRWIGHGVRRHHEHERRLVHGPHGPDHDH